MSVEAGSWRDDAYGAYDGRGGRRLHRLDRVPAVPIPRTYGRVPPNCKARSIFRAPI